MREAYLLYIVPAPGPYNTPAYRKGNESVTTNKKLARRFDTPAEALATRCDNFDGTYYVEAVEAPPRFIIRDVMSQAFFGPVGLGSRDQAREFDTRADAEAYVLKGVANIEEVS